MAGQGCLALTSRWLTRVGKALQTAVFPHCCLECGRFFVPQSSAETLETGAVPRLDGRFESLAAPFLCADCCRSVVLISSPMCRICGIPFTGNAGEDHTCGDCLTTPHHFDIARACGCYDGGLKTLIHQFKYRGIPQLTAPLGALVAWGIWKYFKEHLPDLIIPVPLHPSRMRLRGFNQAYLLMKEAAAVLSVSAADLKIPPIATGLLLRTRATSPQTGLGKAQRRRNIRGAFNVTQDEAIRGKAVLLVDDVLTTGATANECAKILKKAGAQMVAVLSLARAM